jgi:hypothetical protein
LTKVCNSHGYEVNSTAADSSSQNRMVERPHRTLKERMRCMMYSARLPSLDSLITFGAKITAKKPGNRPTALNPGSYDGILLGYQNTMHNIRYWDINTGAIKTAKHDSKDEIRSGDNPLNRSPASKHLMEVFTGSVDHSTATAPEHVEIELKDKMSTSAIDILERSL